MSDDWSEEIALINQYMAELPPPLRDAVQYAMQNTLLPEVKKISSRIGLDDTQMNAFFFECLMVLVGITDLDELKDSCIATLGVTYEQAVHLKHAFDFDIALPVTQDAERRGLNTSAPPPLPAAPAQTRWETCEITFEVVRKTGFITAGEIRWLARATGPTGVYAAGRSDKFWVPNVSSDGGVTMPDASLARKLAIPALDSLTSTLLRDGWEPVANTGGDWWEKQFQRRA
jgi:hypothetical protein